MEGAMTSAVVLPYSILADGKELEMSLWFGSLS